MTQLPKRGSIKAPVVIDGGWSAQSPVGLGATPQRLSDDRGQFPASRGQSFGKVPISEATTAVSARPVMNAGPPLIQRGSSGIGGNPHAGNMSPGRPGPSSYIPAAPTGSGFGALAPVQLAASPAPRGRAVSPIRDNRQSAAGSCRAPTSSWQQGYASSAAQSPQHPSHQMGLYPQGSVPSGRGSPVPSGAPPMSSSNLEVSQRMAKATELQHRLQHKGPAPVSLKAPSLLNWAKEANHGGNRDRDFDDRSRYPCGGMQEPVAGYYHTDADLTGMSTLQNVPPPPRSAPAVDVQASAGYHQNPRSSCAAGVRGEFVLTVLTSDNRWEKLIFTPSDHFEQRAAEFLRQKGLKSAFASGLISKMRSMVASKELQASVDIVDLI